MDGMDFYISSNGFFVIPEINVKYLINISESNLPSMPEARETTVNIPGRDGDITLATAYEPMSFEIVCYTDDGLNQREKRIEEEKINNFLHSIKNRKKKFAIEKDNKFYDVKYSGALTTTNYPAHLKFSIPLKSSSSYAESFKEDIIIGNGEKISNTIEEVGPIITIKGPVQTPEISLNDIHMKYNNVLLENQRLIINAKNSTVIHENSLGVQTNVMMYFNHTFPRIKNGKNVLKILSGIDDPIKLEMRWRDLKL